MATTIPGFDAPPHEQPLARPPGNADDDIFGELVENTRDRDKIVPVGRYRLTFLDATCLIINRMIGESRLALPPRDDPGS